MSRAQGFRNPKPLRSWGQSQLTGASRVAVMSCLFGQGLFRATAPPPGIQRSEERPGFVWSLEFLA